MRLCATLALALALGTAHATPLGIDQILRRCQTVAPQLSSIWYACVGNARRAASPIELIDTCSERKTPELAKECFLRLARARQPAKIIAACGEPGEAFSCVSNAIRAQDAAPEAECRKLAAALQMECIEVARARLAAAESFATSNALLGAAGIQRLVRMRRPDLAVQACKVAAETGPQDRAQRVRRGDACIEAVAEHDAQDVDPRPLTRACVDEPGDADPVCMRCLGKRASELGPLCTSLRATGLSITECACAIGDLSDATAAVACVTKQRAGKPPMSGAEVKAALRTCDKSPPEVAKSIPPAVERACRTITGGANDDMALCRYALVDDGEVWQPGATSGPSHAPPAPPSR